jgi:hypothetical protein
MIVPLNWPKRTIWHGLHRCTLYGPVVGPSWDRNGADKAETYVLMARGREGWDVQCRFDIDCVLLRILAEQGKVESFRRQAIRGYIKAVDQWRRENPPPSKR